MSKQQRENMNTLYIQMKGGGRIDCDLAGMIANSPDGKEE